MLAVLCLAVGACQSAERDMTLPEILAAGTSTSPLNCQEFERGGVLPFSYAFSDNVALGAYNIEIHGNHDHHSHSTEAESCEEDHDHEHGEEAGTGKAWVYNQDFIIPKGSTYYAATVKIPIPADIAPGDYHFMIRVTDAAGWQELKTLSIRIE